MSAVRTVALCASLLAFAAPAMAQLAVNEAPEGMVRPFGSEPLIVAPNSTPPGDCDTACLTGLAGRFMDALAKQDGADLPWADRVRYAENGVTIMVGDGVWATANKLGAAPLIIADAEAHKAVWMGMVEEHGQPGFYALELTAQGDRIAAAQTTIRRQQGRPPYGDPVTFTYDAAFTTPLAKGKETPRAVMTGLVQAYFDAQAGDAAPPPFAKGCTLIENGVAMTGNLPAAKGEKGDCVSSFARGLFQEYEAVRRRIVAVDAEKGVVVVSGARDMPAEKTEFTATDGTSYKAEANYPRSTGFVSVFKIEAGTIARIETIATELPYLMRAPWREGPRGPRR